MKAGLEGGMDLKGKYILSMDQSTSGTKAIIWDENAKIISKSYVEHAQYYPNPGWVEHDPEEIYSKTLMAIDVVLKDKGIQIGDIAVLAITNQRETAVVWDRETGKPVYNAVVWQCQRAADICKELEQNGYGEMIRQKTGLTLSPYFSAAKIKWILDNVKGAREKAKEGRLLCGNIDAWLIWKLTKGKVHATDYSNASRTQLFNIRDLKWDQEILEIFDIPPQMMPEVKFSDEIFGYTDEESGFPGRVPISGIMGDSHAALFGQNCFEKGSAKATYGTGSSVMMNIGDEFFEAPHGLVTSIAWGMSNRVEYVFEGNINCTGATIQWLVDNLQIIPESKLAGEIASTLKDNEGVYLVPAFVGLGAPYWDSEARAAIVGISRGITKVHIVRAAEESIAYQIKDILDLMVNNSGIGLKGLRVDGGPTRDNFLMQFQADILGISVERNKVAEVSALGSAFMAGIAIGLWKSIDDIKQLRQVDKVFTSKMSEEERNRLYKGWKEAVSKVISTTIKKRSVINRCVNLFIPKLSRSGVYLK